MRISSLSTDPGFETLQQLISDAELYVFLNGVEQTSLITVDEEAGMVVAYKRDVHGNFLYDENGRTIVEERFGQCEIVIKRPLLS